MSGYRSGEPPPTARSSTPYRTATEVAPLLSWTVRERLGRVAMRRAAIATAVAASAWSVLRVGGRPVGMALALAAAGAAALWLAALAGRGFEPERVAGGHGEVRLFADRLEVPLARVRDGVGVEVFPIERLQLHVDNTLIAVQFLFVTEITTLLLVAGARRRALSARLFEDREHVRQIADAVARIQAVGHL